MKNLVLYMHGGSQNRGCEAIVRSTCQIINRTKANIYLFSNRPEEDLKSKINFICEVKSYCTYKRYSLEHLLGALTRRLTGNFYFYYKNLVHNCDSETIALSIGGDNYCYDGYPKVLASLNKMLKKRGAKTVLWGCSINPDVLLDRYVVSDLKKYDLITCRDSITYDALLEKGINNNTHLFPDPAFILEKVNLSLPDGFVKDNTVGLNISPLIMKLESKPNIALKNYANLIKYIICNTDMQIALIPHVTRENDNDLVPLTMLYEQFKQTGRVILFGDHYNCMELKGFISRCRIFVGARTHATIAAYSTCVPTLAVGYSVKATGIARDIFGSEERMVISVQELEHENDLLNAFKYIQENEDTIRKHLQNFMPSYKEKSWQAGEKIKELIET
ncbi:MAG: polysaccharide pyruvyl transferase family protein [Dethiobacteria bacterium]|jgi:polysaccharide pyruvyl transferase WcaK-like protein|nr:polysaccharide pyruvyl transferase family protein [Acetivibrio sp.]